MIQVLPAVLEKTEEEYKQTIERIKHSKSFQEGWVHIDFADNEFVQNKTIGADTVGKYPLNLNKEAHLMVAHPLQWLEDLKKEGFKRVIFHYESKDNIEECIDKIKELGMKVGIALNIDTPIEKLATFKDKIDLVLIMSIVPGFQGQPFIPEALSRVREIKTRWQIKVGIDGAVRDNNIKDIMEAGAEFVTVGSYLLKGDIDENLEELWEAIV